VPEPGDQHSDDPDHYRCDCGEERPAHIAEGLLVAMLARCFFLLQSAERKLALGFKERNAAEVHSIADRSFAIPFKLGTPHGFFISERHGTT
jgi:hypothetical protein